MADVTARPFRKIAVEEAFSTPEHMAELKRLVDTHPDYHPDLVLAKVQVAGSPMTQRLLDLEDERIRLMDEAGIDLALLLLTAPGVQMTEPKAAADLSRRINDGIAETVTRHPDRLAALTVVAPQAPEAAAREIERGMKTLAMKGVVVNSHTDGEYLCEPKYAPLLAAAEEFGAPIYIHPRAPIPAMSEAYRPDNLQHAIWGFQAETGLHALRLITSGVFDRFPKLQIVIGHAGEGLPYWLDRIDFMHALPRGRPELEHKPSHYFLNNFSVTTSGMNWPENVLFLVRRLGADRVMFAADYPYQVMKDEVALMDAAPIGDEEREQIYCRTAERVFRL